MTELVQVSLARVLHAHGRPIPPDVEKSYTLALSEVEIAQQAEFDEWRRIKKESMRALRDAADAENRKRLDREAAMRQAQREARERVEAQERADREQYANIPDLAAVEVPEVSGVAGSGVAGSGVAGSGVAGSGVAGSKGPFLARAESAPGSGAGSEGAGDAANAASASQAPAIPTDPGPALDPSEIL